MMRKSNNRKGTGKKSYSILVDGETEIWYLQLMKKHETLPRIDIKPELPKKKSLIELFKLVKQNSKIYDSAILIIDLDVIIRDDQVANFKKLYKQVEKNKRINVLVNNPCLEFWYLLHFKDTSKKYSLCQDTIKDLVKHNDMKSYKKSERYYKNHRNDIYRKLKPFQDTAIRNAEKLGNLDLQNITLAKAELFKIFDLLK